MSERKLSQKELDDLTEKIAEICLQRKITSKDGVRQIIDEIVREAKLKDLLDDDKKHK